MFVSPRDTINESERLVPWDCVIVAVGALTVYEYLLTIGKEIRTLWLRPLNAASILLFLNRYVLILYIFDNMASTMSDLGIKRCYSTTVLGVVCFILLAVLFAFFAAFRAYALWNRNYWIFGLTLAIGLFPVGTNLYALAKLNKQPDANVLGCEITSNEPNNIKSRYDPNFSLDVLYSEDLYSLGQATRISTIVLDWMVLCLTWAKLSSHWKNSKRFAQQSIGGLLLRRGSMYFIVLLLLNSAEIVIFQLTKQTYGTYFITPITSILVSRFIMDLRDMGERYDSNILPQSKQSDQTLSESGLTSFMISDLGQDFSHVLCPFDDDDDDDESTIY
ncbi:hypothetical protein BDY19DRAFT_1054648 [Irpex rosettiformis]|uniref:Uncharacterized protein n=1 Tax=Irpex rosettiformis TaxID=378272 RepID=A0ACB8UDV4_9APHY|nr:hypothetical protein BDY19DRAFT_1054648 [Irpex rosettiformis]